MEAAFPEEAGVMLNNLEHAGDPWGAALTRLEWAEQLDFELRVFGAEGEDKIPDDVEYVFFVGAAPAPRRDRDADLACGGHAAARGRGRVHGPRRPNHR